MKNAGYAFPHDGLIEHGLTIRDYFAAQAMHGLLVHQPVNDPHEANRGKLFAYSATLSREAYQYADAMLAERNK